MVSVRDIVRIVLVVVCVAITLYLLWRLRKPISWLLISIFLAVALSPPVNCLARRMKRGFAIAIVYLGLLLVPILLIALIVPPLITEANNFADNVPQYADDVTEFVQDNERLREHQRGLRHHEQARGGGAASSPNRLGGAAGTLRDIGFGIVSSLFALLTILVMTAFLLGSGRQWIDADHRVATSRAARSAAALARPHGERGERLRGRRAHDRADRRNRDLHRADDPRRPLQRPARGAGGR